MAEKEKKGHVKVAVDVEINEALMEILKESMAKMPEIMKRRKSRKEE